MATGVETGPCAFPQCKHQRVSCGIWCELHEDRESVYADRLRDIGCPDDVIPTMLNIRREMIDETEAMADVRRLAWRRAEVAYARRHRTVPRWLLCVALVGLWAAWEWMR